MAGGETSQDPKFELPYGERGAQDELVRRVLEQIKGERVEAILLSLAQCGGELLSPTTEHPQRFAVNRVALSEADEQARQEIIKPLMESLGLTIIDHPVSTIGILEGIDPTLPPVDLISHTDSVPNGDMYDGSLGVIAALEVINAIQTTGIRLNRSIRVFSLTGEESAAFSMALFGSRAIYHELTDDELDSRSALTGASIRETFGAEKSSMVKRPLIGPDADQLMPPAAVIELHVEQHNSLEAAGIDLGIVEAIAAPVRYKATIGEDDLHPDTATYPHEKYLRLTVAGVADHSGATPMGSVYRADGLVATAEFLSEIIQVDHYNNVTIGNIQIADQAINKIPGQTETTIRLTSEYLDEIEEMLWELHSTVIHYNDFLNKGTRFTHMPLNVDEIEKPAEPFFAREKILPRQLAALELISGVESEALYGARHNVVGTIGTYDTGPGGAITLRVDIRGINKQSRDQVISKVQDLAAESKIDLGQPLPGSGDPVGMHPDLVAAAMANIHNYDIGSARVMYSAAGHDAQNAARAGIPAVMIFCQSNNNGIAHHPDAYTHPANIEKGTKALAALTLHLAA